MKPVALELLSDQLNTLKQADWYYEYCDDGAAYRRGQASVQKAIAVLAGIDEKSQDILVEQFVPKELQDGVKKSIKRGFN